MLKLESPITVCVDMPTTLHTLVVTQYIEKNSNLDFEAFMGRAMLRELEAQGIEIPADLYDSYGLMRRGHTLRR